MPRAVPLRHSWRRNRVRRNKKNFIPEVNNSTDSLDTINIPIKDILRDEDFQVRKSLNKTTINRYVSVYKSGKTMPPVTVARINKGLILVDGWHRIAALESLGRFEVSAKIIETTAADAKWLAAQANTEHGLQLKSSEVRKVFKAFMKAGKYKQGQGKPKSYRDIAKELGGLKSHNTIRNWMRQDFPKIFKQYNSEEPDRGQGGLAEINIEHDHVVIARDSLDKALTAFRCVNDPHARGRLIEHTEGLLKDMKDEKPWEPSEY
jgi:hypothetical protein